MGLVQWVIIIILVAIILFGFAAVFDFSKGVVRNVYPANEDRSVLHISESDPFIVANVTRVIDGDTIEIEGGERIRFAIVNTPEKWEEGWKEAKDYTTERCLGKTAVIDIDNNQDRTYGRLVGLVYCGVEGYFINLELLALQYAVVMPQFCKYSEFKDGILCQYQVE
jgi:endonuclease YncB( thermonuclease family)